MTQNLPLRIAHLSDLHFSTVTWNPTQFLSKRWMGNWNLILFRRKRYQTYHLMKIPEFLKSLKVNAVCITGDVATTSLEKEFQLAQNFLNSFAKWDLPLYLVPGNHDCYTKKAERTKLYYSYFPSPLSEKKVMKASLGGKWWYIGLDCAVATGWLQSYGAFSKEIEDELIQTLDTIDKNDKVILANHFPLFPTGRTRHDLRNCKRLQEITFRYPQIKVYLHGHDHHHYILDKREEGYPLILNSGSCAHAPNGTFYLLDLYDDECLVQRLYYEEEKDQISWVIKWEKNYQYLR